MIKQEKRKFCGLKREKKIQNDFETIILIAWWWTLCVKQINECETWKIGGV